ncbi:MAG: VIT family protein [Propionibacteriaceae bacterium]|nr:VIT family protein [Propionibacteriaceae bacterium]
MAETIEAPEATDFTKSSKSLASRLNWLRAGVLGANDGIVSVAGILMGVAGAAATSDVVETQHLFISGLAGLVAGAFAMAGGEYVSVSTQKDTELGAVKKVRHLLDTDMDRALTDLAGTYEEQGFSKKEATSIAKTLTDHDAIGTHTQARYGISAHEQTSPWAAAFASFIAFTAGALIPMLAMASPPNIRVAATLIAVTLALALTGVVSAWLGQASKMRALVRNIIVGALAMSVTYGIGILVGMLGIPMLGH